MTDPQFTVPKSWRKPTRREVCRGCGAAVLPGALTEGVCDSCVAQAAGETLLALLAWLGTREQPPLPDGPHAA